jgi:eukaryotic-like serine/threonine-protein kinase
MDLSQSQQPTAQLTDVTRLPKPSSDQLKRIHLVCTQFELAWNSLPSLPAIESYLTGASQEDYPHLLESLIRSQRELEASSGRETELSEFVLRFPSDRGVILRAFIDTSEVEKLDGLSKTHKFGHDSTLSAISQTQAPTQLGSFVIQQEIARGGMGIIYRARHAELDRIVALKIIRSGQLANESEVARFRQEAMAAAGLQHEGIVPVYEVGSDQGFHFYSMPLIEGEDLGSKFSVGPQEAREIARIVRDVAIAVQFAHDHGVVHRDLKPRNILVDTLGKIHILDFGLATFIDREQASLTGITQTGEVIGTPAYMSPEQVVGKADKLSDVYSLGAILYAGLCGRPPHQAATVMETLRQILDREPVAPQGMNPLIPKDLETITLKLISKSPAHRYQSAAVLADELTRFLDGRPIQARPISPPEQLWRWAKRQPVVAGLATAVFVSLSLGFAASLWMYSIARSNEITAIQNADIAAQTVKKYLTDVANNPELKAAGMEALRRDLLRNAQQFYQQLERQPTNSPKLEKNLADTHFQLANISSELGELNEADQYYDKVLSAYRNLSEAEPDLLDYERGLSAGLQKQSPLRKLLGQEEPAAEKLYEAVQLRRKILDRSHLPGDRLRLASALAEMGQQSESTQQADEQQKLFDEVAALCDELSDQLNELQPEDVVIFLQTVDQVALNAQMRGNFDAAIKWFESGKQISKSLLASDQDNPTLQNGLARAHKGLYTTLLRMQRFDEAIQEFRDGDVIFQRLCSDHPLVIDYLDGHATLTFNHGTQLAMRGKLDEAEQVLRQAYRLQTTLVNKQAESFENHNALGLFCSTLATVLIQRGQLDEAEMTVLRGLEAMAVATSLQPENSAVIYFSAALNNTLGNLYRSKKKDIDAIAAFQKAATACKELFSKDNSKLPYAVLAATSLRNQAVALRMAGEMDRARQAALEGLALSRQLLERSAESVEFKTLHATIQIALAAAYHSLGQLPDAKTTAEEGHATLTTLIATAQSPQRFQVSLAETCYILGKVAATNSEHQVALDWFDSALAAQKLDFESKSTGLLVERQRSADELGKFHLEKAKSLIELGRFADALIECQAAVQSTDGRLESATKLLVELQEKMLVK